MALTSTKLRTELKKYREDLIHRVRQVKCFRCGAKSNEPCVGSTGRIGQWCHWTRHNEAKRVGLVKGRWFDEKKWKIIA